MQLGREDLGRMEPWFLGVGMRAQEREVKKQAATTKIGASKPYLFPSPGHPFRDSTVSGP